MVRHVVRRAAAALASLAVFAACTAQPSPGRSGGADAAQPASCPPALGVYVRGSGEPLGNPGAVAFIRAVGAAVPGARALELGDDSVRSPGVQRYPAARIDRNIAPRQAGPFDAQPALDYGDSVRDGVAELVGLLSTYAVQCPTTPQAVMGYSQGAQVAGQAVSQLASAGVSGSLRAVALVGDPSLHLPEGEPPTSENASPPACRGVEYSWWRYRVPSCGAHRGLLGSRTPYLPAELQGKAAAWCAPGDVVCGAGRDLRDWQAHFSYEENGYAEQARTFVTAGLTGAPVPEVAAFPVDHYAARIGESITVEPRGAASPLTFDPPLPDTVINAEPSPPARLAFDAFYDGEVIATGSGGSPLRAHVSATTLDTEDPLPAPPTDLRSRRDGDTIELEWKTGERGIRGWGIWVDHFPVGILLGRTAQTTITGVPRGAGHTVGVSALRSDGSSSVVTSVATP